MRTISVLLTATLGLVLAPGAQAQSADTQYCLALSGKYDRYVNNPNKGRGSAPPNGRLDEAKSQCTGNPSYAIPILEQALRDARVDLPPRG